MTRNKILLCGLFTGLILCLSACGQGGATTKEVPQVTVEEIPVNDNAGAGKNVAADANSDSQSEDADGSLSADASDGDANSDTIITITFEEVTENQFADDGTEVYVGVCSYPIVEISNHPEAASMINAEIMETVDALKSGTEIGTLAKNDYEFMKEDNDLRDIAADFFPYTDQIDYSVSRADTDVISFVISAYSDSGGAHGNHTTYAKVFDPNTGAKLSFSDLSDDAELFRINTLQYNQKTAATEEYAEKLFSTDSITNGELENALYEEEKWFFSEEGLVFISDPYLLGPWAAGTIEFMIPYEELAGMGMKEIYSHPGPQAEIISQ